MPFTKDTTHIRRSKDKIDDMVTFLNDMTLDMKKDVFLANPHNKQKFINNLRDRFSENGLQTLRAERDADLSIVKIAVWGTIKYKTALVGEDADLLKLLCYSIGTASANSAKFR